MFKIRISTLLILILIITYFMTGCRQNNTDRQTNPVLPPSDDVCWFDCDFEVEDDGGEHRTTTPASILVAAGPGGGPHVRLMNGTDSTNEYSSYWPYPNFGGGVYVASGDLNCDGFPDVITGAGKGGGPHVKVFDGINTGVTLASFFAFDAGFTGGVRVAAGDVDGDGCDELIVAAGKSGGPHVKVFRGTDLTLLASFFAYTPEFTGGVFVASGDTNGDGLEEVITGAGDGGGPHVIAFDMSDLNRPQPILSFFAYVEGFTGGVRVASGDFDGDGLADIVTGAGPGGGPHVRIFNGLDASEIRGFFPYNAAFHGGVFVATGDLNGDGLTDLITGADAGGGSHVLAFGDGQPDVIINNFLAFPGFTGGVRVGSF